MFLLPFAAIRESSKLIFQMPRTRRASGAMEVFFSTLPPYAPVHTARPVPIATVQSSLASQGLLGPKNRAQLFMLAPIFRTGSLPVRSSHDSKHDPRE
jgi:hypothetical protein